MGKPTGFLDFLRQGNPSETPEERITHFNEFHPMLAEEDRRRQGGRCMECGVPFCQSGATLGGMTSGCPLSNLVPEWNDLIYNGNFAHALERLHKTSNFPEFTGRVCPALCEAACTCGMTGDPVTVKENELGIIEDGWAKGLITPRTPKVRTGKKVAVVGSGPSGLATADQLNRRGHWVTVYEREDRIGGLLMYGIPNMKLEKPIIDRRVNLMKEEGVTFITNVNVGVDITAAHLSKDYDAIVLCCGASNPRDLNIPGRDANGVYFAVDFLKSTTKSLLNSNLTDGNYINAKGKHVVIVGGGDTGNDCVGTSIRHGCASVVQVEMMPKAPDQRADNNPWPQWPKISKTDYGQQEAIAVFVHDPRIYETTLTDIIKNDQGDITGVKTVKLAPGFKQVEGSEEILPCDILLIAAGFLGAQQYMADAFGLEMTPRTAIATPEGSYATNQPKIFAAGDMRRGQSLVVWGIKEGRMAAREVDLFLMGTTNLT